MNTIWRTDRADIIASYRDNETAAAAYMKRLDKQLKAWGFSDTRVWFSDSAFGGIRRLLGVPLPDGVTYHKRDTWPEGWRVERDRGYLIPARSTKPGKAVAKIWDELVRDYPSPRKVLHSFGMPLYAMVGMHAYAPAMRLVGDTIWVKWQCDPNADEKVDLDVWTQVKLSEYFAMVEAGNDPFNESTSDDEDAA